MVSWLESVGAIGVLDELVSGMERRMYATPHTVTEIAVLRQLTNDLIAAGSVAALSTRQLLHHTMHRIEQSDNEKPPK